MTNGTGSRATPTRTRMRAARARNRVASMPTPCSTTRSSTALHAVTVAAGRVLETGVTGVREEEIEHLRLRTVATAITPASLRGNVEARIHRRD